MSTDAERPDAELEGRLGHRFEDTELLTLALTHPSYSHEADGSRGNERLEFLGDAVLDVVVGRLLYEAHPDWPEGHLTRARAALVNAAALAMQARDLGLAEHVRLGRTEERSGGAEKDSILANVFEAVLGALYLDGGLEPLFALVRDVFGEALASGDAVLERDAKTSFQEWAHRELTATPRYRLLADSAVEDAEDRFEVAVEVGSEEWGRGRGRSKRAAEQAAAVAALQAVSEA
jgi:ribonuclease-3